MVPDDPGNPHRAPQQYPGGDAAGNLYLDIVQKWIERMDDAYYSEADMRLYVCRCRIPRLSGWRVCSTASTRSMAQSPSSSTDSSRSNAYSPVRQ